MKINEHQKKGCDKAMDSEGNPFKLKLYPPLRNATKGVYIVKGGNTLEYRAKANELSKPRNSCPLTTLTLHLVQTFEHKHKKEKIPPLEIHDEVQEEFVVCKKHLMKHESSIVKQIVVPKRILEHPILLKLITQEKSQHNGIGSHLFYLNLHHCNVFLSFNNIQFIIVLV